MSIVTHTKNSLGKPRFGDARDAYIKSLSTDQPNAHPCTSKSLSTMPRRQR